MPIPEARSLWLGPGLIGIFGGTFDPVHNGHLQPVREVQAALELEEVRYVPCARPPHRPAPAASARERLAMLRLALAQTPGVRIDERELRAGGVSYTVLTLQGLRAELGEGPLCFILGADEFSSFETWYRWQEIPDLAHIVVMHRPGWPWASAARGLPPWAHRRLARHVQALRSTAGGLVWLQPVTPVDVSATAIRRALARGEDVSGLLPPAVLAYIRRHGLYGASGSRRAAGESRR